MSWSVPAFVTSVSGLCHFPGTTQVLLVRSQRRFLCGQSVCQDQAQKLLTARRSSRCAGFSPRMLQSPDSDGPPSLDSFAASQELLSSMKGTTMSIGTSRVAAPADGNASTLSDAVAAGVRKAVGNVDGPIRAIHITMPPSVPARVVRDAVIESAGSTTGDSGNNPCVIGRSIVKDGGGDQRIELMIIAGGDAAQSGSMVGGTASECAKQALTSAAQSINGPAAFGIFVADGNFSVDQVRAGFKEIAGDFPMYGGCAQGVGETASEWTVIHNDGVRDVDNGPDGMVFAAVFQGKMSFLLSSLVKNWAQPKYMETMSFLKPSYVGIPEEDLLLAIKFDDWDKFIECIETKGVDVNVKWSSRQNQSPLLAAVARGRYKMIEYLLQNGADVSYRNAGGYNSVMYTLRLKEYGEEFIDRQMDLLVKYGADINDTEVII